MPLTTGQILQNRYRIAALLGEGGMGAVYRARDLRLEKPVALKEMVPQPGLPFDTLSQLRTQFRQEAVVLGKLKHQHLVPVTDYFEEEGNDYLVMEFVEGENLAERIGREGALPETQVVPWARQLLDALGYCQAQGVIHRDIKPQNVVVTPAGEVVLVDFGLVKLWDPSDPHTRTVLRGVGTPEYSPPEQWGALGHHTDPRSDLYSLGATLYHALTGQAPLTASDRMAYPKQFKTPRELTGQVSEHVDAAITRSMALACDDRWPDARAMAAAFDAVPTTVREVAGTPVGARTAARTSVAPQAPVPVPTKTGTKLMPEASPKSVPMRRGRVPAWVWALGGVAVIVAVIAAAGGFRAKESTGVPMATAPVATRVEQEAQPAPPTVRPTATPEQANVYDGILKVALLAPLSGDVATFGQSVREGAMLAVEAWNAEGGVLGKRIEVVLEDSQCNAEAAVIAANKVIDQDGVEFIIGEVCSSASIPISEIAAASGVLQISPTSTNAGVTLAQDGATKPTVFRACFIDPFQAKAAARFATDTLGAGTAAVLLDQGSDYVRGQAEAFIQAFEDAGGQVLVRETYTRETQDFSGILAKVKSADPDILYLPDYYSTVNRIAAQAKVAEIRAVPMGGDGWDSPDLDLSALEGGYFTNHFSPDDTRPIAQDFVSRYEATYGNRPDALAALAYDSADMLFRAIAEAGSDDPTAVARTLETTQFALVTGDLAYDDQHNPIKDVVVLEIRNGEVRYAATVPAGGSAGIDPEYASDAVFTDDFTTLSEAAWDADTSSVVLNPNEGTLGIQGHYDWATYLRYRRSIEEGQAVLILYKCDPDTELEAYLDMGDWQQSDYRRWGVYLAPGLWPDVYQGATIIDDQRVVVEGDLVVQPDTWYYIVLSVGDGSDLVAGIWERSRPERTIRFAWSPEDAWDATGWQFSISANSGRAAIDGFAVLDLAPDDATAND